MKPISFDDFDNLCNALGFGLFPRAIGNPRQQFSFATEDVFRRFNKWNGHNSCFISTSGYDDLRYEVGGKQVPNIVNHTLTFFDFDHETKPENAFADAQRLSAFLRDLDVAHWVQYSGSKGYHLFILHSPTRFKFSHRDRSSEALKHLLSQTQEHLKQVVGLNTLDEQTTGDPKRLCRFPFTKHCDRHGNVKGKYSIPIPLDYLDDMSHSDIEMMAYRPKFHIPNITGKRFSLKEFIDLIGVDLQSPVDVVRPMVNMEFDFENVDAEANRFIGSLEKKCMGIVNELKRRNPPHKARVHSALFAKFLGMDSDAFERIWVELGERIGYVDLHNHEYRQYQMSTIFDNPKYFVNPNCTTLKKDGCCVGEICPKYKDISGMDYTPRKIKRKWVKRSASNKDN